ncbi:hypothetical protein C7S18_10245 [Ahniella affigens]|uniref:Uncharacterized protein n=1 Tax=Ahniella affigens TaxID=2021234 RepID=A0A2P1PRU9_9GAMM|nr:hypothetical protein [Ahniella affigens]AVP97552.1 hypothetical protein C7S18_10245 [Ahniella affigens]
MNIGYKILAVAILSTLGVKESRAASDYTDEQLAQIAALLDRVRAEVRVELKAEVREEVLSELAASNAITGRPEVPESGHPEAADGRSTADSSSLDGAREAQLSALLATRESKSRFVANAFLMDGSSAPLERENGPASTGLELLASTDDTRATFKYAAELSYAYQNGVKSFTTSALTLSAPLSEAADGITEIATLDGLANSTEIGVSFSRWYVKEIGEVFDIKTADAICKAAGIDTSVLGTPCDTAAVMEGLANEGKLDEYPRLKALFYDPSRWDREAFRWTWGLSGRVGYESFDFFGPDLEEISSSENPWSVNGYFGWVPPNSTRFYSLGATIQNAYKPADEATACTNSEMPVLECVTGSLAAPTEKRKHLMYLEARGQVSGIGYALRATHDLKSDASGLDLPIYLFKDPEGSLNAGIRLGWTSTDQGSVGLFIGSPFSLF